MNIVPSARRHRRHPIVWLCAIAAVLALAACGKTSSTSSSSSSATAASSSSSGSSSATKVAASSGGCGSVATLPYHDQSGVLSALGSGYTSQFNGYATPIFKSAYAHFKPAGKPPYTVGISVTAPVSPTQAALIPLLQRELKAVKGVGKVILLTSPPTGLTTQLQQAHSLIQQHVSFLVAEPLVPQPFIPIAAAAKAAGIPFISIFNATPSPSAINIAPNSVGDALTSGAKLAKLIGGKGIVLGVHGIEATGVDQESFAGWKLAFAKCPGIHFDTSIVGQFQPSVAKAQMLTYLSSHPQPVAGVVESAGMTSGILQAFQQTGRPLPVFVAAGPSVGEIAFFKSQTNRLVSAYTITPQGVVAATAFTISQLIAGHGPKVSELSSLSDDINSSNLSHWAPANASVSNQSVVEGPWLSKSYLVPLFNK